MLTLYQTQRAWGVPNISPFCTKLETYLRMAEIPYQVAGVVPATRRSSLGKVPFIVFEGRTLADSSLIITFLKERLGDPLDGQLSPRERAVGHLVQRTLEEGSYWAIIYARWHDDANFEVMRQVYFERTVGRALRWIIPDLVRRRLLAALHLQGTSQNDRAWVFSTVARDVAAVSELLGDKPYLFGDAPTSYDAVVYAMCAGIWRTPFAKDFAPAPANIEALIARIEQRYFPELVARA